MKKNLKGFTLVEVLIVIIIIGILIAALLPRLTGGQARARDLSRQQGVEQLATAIQLLITERGALDDTGTNNVICVDDTAATNVDGATLSAYLREVPYNTGYNTTVNGTTCTNQYAILVAGDGLSAIVLVDAESTSAGNYTGVVASTVTGGTTTLTAPAAGVDLIGSRVITR